MNLLNTFVLLCGGNQWEQAQCIEGVGCGLPAWSGYRNCEFTRNCKAVLICADEINNFRLI